MHQQSENVGNLRYSIFDTMHVYLRTRRQTWIGHILTSQAWIFVVRINWKKDGKKENKRKTKDSVMWPADEQERQPKMSTTGRNGTTRSRLDWRRWITEPTEGQSTEKNSQIIRLWQLWHLIQMVCFLFTVSSVMRYVECQIVCFRCRVLLRMNWDWLG